MKIIPVLDVLGGVAVHAVGGRRKDYQPLKSVLCASSEPIDLAVALKALGFSELYVADLDSITGRPQNLSLLTEIAEATGSELMVDAGVSSLKAAEDVLNSQASKVIIGTETLTSASFVGEAIAIFGSEKIVVSLDMMGKCVLSRFKLGRLAEPVAFVRELEEQGVSYVILLDLEKVGSGEGANIPFLKDVLNNVQIDVLVGGGVRDIKDLLELKELGVFGALVATALHSGEISPKTLKQCGLL